MTFICPVCDNDEYEESDGLYYCTVCSTQSQQLIKQVVEENFDESVNPSFWKSEIKTKKNNKNLQKRRNDYGRAWTLYEAYQFIILAQADALVGLGARTELKEIVFSLWAQYLSKIGVAFCKVEKVVPEIILRTGKGRQRELHRGTLACPINRNKRPFDEVKEPSTPKAKVAKLDTSEINPCGGNEQNEIENGDKFKEKSEKPSPRCTDNIIFVDERPQYKALSKRVLRSPQWMDLKKTIAISYLGIRYTNPEILPVDVVRWIYEGKVPYLSTTHLLPSDMVMSGQDEYLFETGGINSDQLIHEMNKVCFLLRLKNAPTTSVSSVLGRFLKELDLPDKLKGVCMELSKNTNYQLPNQKTVYTKPEFVAVLYIGLAIKLLFGLDGSTEGKLSSYSIKVRSMFTSDMNIFVFDEWKRHMVRKSYRTFDAHMEIHRNVMISNEARHVDKLLECYNNLQRDEKPHAWKEIFIQKGNRQGFRKVLRNPLSMVIARTDQEQPKKTMKLAHTDIDLDLGKAGNNFRNSTLTHMADFSYFKSKFLEQICKEDWAILEKEIRDITKSIIYAEYAFESDEDILMSSRPHNYFWMLKLLVRITNSSILSLDQGINKLHKQLKGKTKKKAQDNH